MPLVRLCRPGVPCEVVGSAPAATALIVDTTASAQTTAAMRRFTPLPTGLLRPAMRATAHRRRTAPLIALLQMAEFRAGTGSISTNVAIITLWF
jgi:hypothetical protein